MVGRGSLRAHTQVVHLDRFVGEQRFLHICQGCRQDWRRQQCLIGRNTANLGEPFINHGCPIETVQLFGGLLKARLQCLQQGRWQQRPDSFFHQSQGKRFGGGKPWQIRTRTLNPAPALRRGFIIAIQRKGF